MSGPYGWTGPFSCPFCGEPDQEAEDLGDSPDFLTGECGECGRGFSVSVMSEVFYDERGEEIKKGVNGGEHKRVQ